MNLNWTIVGQSLTFLVFIFFCMKFVWPALIAVMQVREKRIADGLEAADKADKDVKLAQQEAMKKLHEAKETAAQIVDQANKRASQIVEEAKEHAREEADRIKTAAHAEVEREITQAREQLRGQVSTLALVGAEKVLGSSVDAKQHADMLDQLSAQL